MKKISTLIVLAIIMIGSSALAEDLNFGTSQTYLKLGVAGGVSNNIGWESEYTRFQCKEFEVEQTFYDIGITRTLIPGDTLATGINSLWIGGYTGLVTGVQPEESGRLILSTRGGFNLGQNTFFFGEYNWWGKHNAQTNYTYSDLLYGEASGFRVGLNYEGLDISGEFQHYLGGKIHWNCIGNDLISGSLRLQTFTLLNGECAGTTDIRIGFQICFKAG